MTSSTTEMIAWMQARKGNVSYSMDHRDGPYSYDCSSAIYYAGISGGMSKLDWACSTETEHDWLKDNDGNALLRTKSLIVNMEISSYGDKKDILQANLGIQVSS